MKKPFNVSRYRELLKKVDFLKQQNKFLFDEPEFIELVCQKASVEQQIMFSRKSEYYSLIQEYLNKTLAPHIF